MPPKSKKGQKMDLSAFLADENTGGSWADEMDTLPTGPSAAAFGDAGVGLGGSHLTRNMRGQDGPGGFGGRDRYDDGRPQRAEVPIPTEPPFTCFVGNLTFEVIEPDVEDFFTGLSVKSVRLVSGQDGKPRGFGYVEFNTVDDLKNALTLSGQDLGGRVVRISVAEAQAARTGRADEATSWERTGPLPSLGGRSGGFGAGRSGGFGGPGREGGGFDEVEREGPIRGGKFVPSAGGGGGGGGFSSSSGRPDRGPGFSGFERAPQAEVERDGPIRGGKFTPSQPEPAAPRRMFSGAGEPSRADEGPWTRGQALPPPPPGAERRSFGTGFGSRENSSSEIPIARRPLQLAARSASTTAIAPSSTPASPGSGSSTPKSNPFGNAKPIDTAAKEKEVEEKLAKERLERAAAAQKDKEEREKQQQATTTETSKSSSDGDWVRRGPLPQRQPSSSQRSSSNLAPPVPIVGGAAPSSKDQPPHVAATTKAPAPAPAASAWGKKSPSTTTTTTEEITKGVEETKI
ncbi:hypothetical protein JCM3766R1_006663 [Sporobolomyces carnicolor]